MLLRPFLMGIAVSLNAVWTLAAAESSPAVATLRVLTYNIHHGEGVDGKLDLVRLARARLQNHISQRKTQARETKAEKLATV
jgi:hypothetical protein